MSGLDAIKAGDVVVVYPHAYGPIQPCYVVKVDRVIGNKRRTIKAGDFSYMPDGRQVGGGLTGNRIRPVTPEALADFENYRSFQVAKQQLEKVRENILALTPDQRLALIIALEPFCAPQEAGA